MKINNTTQSTKESIKKYIDCIMAYLCINPGNTQESYRGDLQIAVDYLEACSGKKYNDFHKFEKAIINPLKTSISSLGVELKSSAQDRGGNKITIKNPNKVKEQMEEKKLFANALINLTTLLAHHHDNVNITSYFMGTISLLNNAIENNNFDPADEALTQSAESSQDDDVNKKRKHTPSPTELSGNLSKVYKGAIKVQQASPLVSENKGSQHLG
jgi:hypothetical protein